MNLQVFILSSLASFLSVYLLVYYLNFDKTIKSLMLAISKGLSVFSEMDLSDEDKEGKLRQQSLSVIFNGVYLAIKVLSLLIPFTIAYAVLYSIQESSINSLGKQIFGAPNLVLLCIASIGSFFILRKRTLKNHLVGFKSSYTLSQQITHNLAMIPIFMKSMGAIDNIFKSNSMSLEQKPVFIIGLARAGTTALLNALHSKLEFSSYTYRFMPFITMPIVVNAFSKRSNNESDKLRERAHGDGHKIGFNSPEAFDEILWKLYFPHIYKSNYIEGIEKHQLTKSFINFFKLNLSKISYLTKKDLLASNQHRNVRYISKNNANITRVNAIKYIFPQAFFVVIFRDPISHAESLLRQHKKFSSIHKNEPFVLKYMDDLGHNEFGLNAKSLFLKKEFISSFSMDSLEYWLDYWIYVYGYVIEEHSDLVFVSLEDFVSNEKITMKRLLNSIDANDQSWEGLGVYFASRDSNPPLKLLNKQQSNLAYSIHDRMLSLASSKLPIDPASYS